MGLKRWLGLRKPPQPPKIVSALSGLAGGRPPLRYQHVNLTQLRYNLFFSVPFPRHLVSPQSARSQTQLRTTSMGADHGQTKRVATIIYQLNPYSHL